MNKMMTLVKTEVNVADRAYVNDVRRSLCAVLSGSVDIYPLDVEFNPPAQQVLSTLAEVIENRLDVHVYPKMRIHPHGPMKVEGRQIVTVAVLPTMGQRGGRVGLVNVQDEDTTLLIIKMNTLAFEHDLRLLRQAMNECVEELSRPTLLKARTAPTNRVPVHSAASAHICGGVRRAFAPFFAGERPVDIHLLHERPWEYPLLITFLGLDPYLWPSINDQPITLHYDNRLIDPIPEHDTFIVSTLLNDHGAFSAATQPITSADTPRLRPGATAQLITVDCSVDDVYDQLVYVRQTLCDMQNEAEAKFARPRLIKR